MNQIRKVVQSRIDSLIQLSELANEVKHSPSVGALRESNLIDFLTHLVPDTVSLTSGFITDASGKISPQLDLIITKRTALPLLEMKDGLSIVPVESALLVAEIKSNLDTKSLKQVETQNKSIGSMNISGNMGSSNFIIPTIILSYDSKVKKERLIKWMEKNANTVACCIFTKETYVRDKNIVVFEKIQNEIKHFSVLAFISTFYRMIEELISRRDFEPNFSYYLIEDVKID